MESNQFRDYIRELNKREAVEHELKRQAALKRIKLLRQQQKEKQNG
jgi:hypothetical protein